MNNRFYLSTTFVMTVLLAFVNSVVVHSTFAQDCNHNAVDDSLDVDVNDPDGNGSISLDCNSNLIPDECEVDQLIASLEPDPNDNVSGFGASVSVFGNLAVVGNGDGQTEGEIGVYATIFELDEIGGDTATKLTGSGWPVDLFNAAVSVSVYKDTCIIGEWRNASVGGAFLFQKVGGIWTETYMVPSPPGAEYFNQRIVINDTSVFIADPGDTDTANQSGAVYVYDRTINGLVQTAKIKSTSPQSFAYFGFDVSVDNDVAIIGEYLRNPPGQGSTGAANIFRRINGQWQEEQVLWASDPGSSDLFGHSVSIEGNTAIVGAPQNDIGGGNTGSVYVFEYDGGVWQQTQRFESPNPQNGVRFGRVVSLQNGMLIVTSYRSSFLFKRIDGSWQFVKRVNLENGQLTSAFDDRHVLIGNYPAQLVDIRAGDCNLNGIPDDCDAPGDLSGDGQIDLSDIDGMVATLLGGQYCELADLNNDMTVDGADIAALITILLAP